MGNAFTEIADGLNEAIAHAKGEANGITEHPPEMVDVKSLRQRMGMSQQRFCATFGISIDTLRHWEQGLRTPRGAARVLLKVVEQNPEAVIKALS